MKKTFNKIIGLAAVFAVLFSVFACSYVPFETKELARGKVGVEYSGSIASGRKDMYYDLDYDSELPKGLILLDDGSIIGTPEQAGKFEFKAVSIDMNDVEEYADFTIEIDKGELVYTATALADGKTGEPYLQSVATATGMPGITYALKQGSSLPSGLTLAANGELSGIPDEVAENAKFTVVASAEGCDDAEADFTVTIEQGEVIIEDLGYIVFDDFALADGLVGDAYSQSVRKAYGVPNITYSFRFSAGQGLPAGLTANKELGIISGTPTDSTDSRIRFRVTASAEGYDSVTAYVTLNVYDKYVATNKFETEYVDTINKLSGAGYSSSPSGRGMIQKCAKMSNGYNLGYLNKAVTIVYKITAASDTSATLTLGLGSEVGDFVYDPSMFSVKVNGKEVNYGTISVKQIGTSEADYESRAYTLSPAIELVAGENTITFEIKNSDKATGTYAAVGCLFDYIELTGANCELGWRPRTANC